MRKEFAFSFPLLALVLANWTNVTGRIRKDAQHTEEEFELMHLPLYNTMPFALPLQLESRPSYIDAGFQLVGAGLLVKPTRRLPR